MIEKETFPKPSQLIPMHIALATSRMRLLTVVAAWNGHVNCNAKKSTSGRDYYQFNLQKFAYLDSIKPKDFKEIYTKLDLNNALKWYGSKLTFESINVVFHRCL